MARDPYLVAVDFGSNSIKVVVAKDTLDEQNKIQILALVERPSSGLKKGIVTNMSEATESLIEAINQAESIIGLPIKSAIFGVSGVGVSFVNSEGLVVISRPDGEITENDIDRVIQDIFTKAFGLQNQETLHIIPKSFLVDNQTGIRYPAGMLGSKLEVKTLVISVETTYLRNFTKVISQASVDIEDQIFSLLASGDFLLTSRQKKAGTALVDIGATSTSFIIWENEELCHSGVIPLGSDHITNDLAVGLQTTMEMAEEIKKQHLDLTTELSETKNLDQIEMYNPDLQTNETFKTREIQEYARARAEELFILLNKELRKIGKNGQLPGGVVLIGGGSSLVGIQEVARDILRLPIFRHSFDKNLIEFIPDYNGDPSFINAIALAAYYIYHGEESASSKNYKRQNQVNQKPNQTSNSGIGNFLRNLWPFS